MLPRINRVSEPSVIKHVNQARSLEHTTIASFLNNSTKLHAVQNTIYKIQKNALSNYLKGSKLDARLSRMNLLQASQIKEDDILTLQQAFLDENSKQDYDLQQRAGQVLNHFRHRRRKNKYDLKIFEEEESKQSDEIDIQLLSNKLKDILDQKIKCQKLFNGTYLVDPNFQEIDRIQTRKSLPSLRSPRLPPLPTYESLSGQTVNEAIEKQRDMLENLRRRFSSRVLSQQEEAFFKNMKQRDYAELTYKLTNDRKLANSVDEKGNSALHVAVVFGDPKLVQLLLNFGADRRALNNVWLKFMQQKKTPIQLASVYLNDEITGILKR